MERLWIANIAPGTSDDEIKALVAKYARDPMECVGIEHVAGDGSRPAVMARRAKDDLGGGRELRPVNDRQKRAG